MTEPIRVVVVDDQSLVRAGLVMLLDAEEALDVVGESADGAAAVTLVERERPDVALMDVRMPVMDGIAATQRIVADPALPTRVLVLTTFDTDETVLEALRAGASGFLLKDAEPETIIRAVRNVAAGDAVLAPAAMARLLARTQDAAGDDAAAGPASATRAVPPKVSAAVGSLTEREREVLTLVARGLTNAEIAAELFLADTTVKTHVHRIMGKLSARDRVQAVLIAHRAGLVP